MDRHQYQYHTDEGIARPSLQYCFGSAARHQQDSCDRQYLCTNCERTLFFVNLLFKYIRHTPNLALKIAIFFRERGQSCFRGSTGGAYREYGESIEGVRGSDVVGAAGGEPESAA